jgi:hypothetical protein
MSRVEITENHGPEAFVSFSGNCASTPCFSEPFLAKLYTLHSYQAIHDSGGTNVTFEILGSNVSDPSTKKPSSLDSDWSVISSHSLNTNDNLAYSDFWNFKFSKIKITGNTSANIKVLEKHNA